MKTILVLTLCFLAQQSFAEVRSCIPEANTFAQQAFAAHLESIPNSSSPDGLSAITTPDRVVNGEQKYNARGEYFTYVRYGFSYDVEVRIALVLASDCTLRGRNLTEKVLNIEPPADEKRGQIPCADEIGLVCGSGMIDRCAYPKAETHHCVPNVQGLGNQISPPSPTSGGM